MKTSEVLTKAKALIATPDTWMQGDFTENRNGIKCFCTLGAIAKVYGEEPNGYDWMDDAPSKLLRDVSGSWSVSIFNDSHPHNEVIELLDKAISTSIERGD